MAEGIEKKFAQLVVEKLKQGKNLIANGPNQDPDYSEFWAEAHPNKDLAQNWPSVPSWKENPMQLASWSEEMYHDIGPGWSEASHIEELMKNPAKANLKPNMVMTAKWPQVNEDFYKSLYKSLKIT